MRVEKGRKREKERGKGEKESRLVTALEISLRLSLSVLRPGRNFRLEKWAERRKKIGVLAEEDSRGEKNCNRARPWG